MFDPQFKRLQTLLFGKKCLRLNDRIISNNQRAIESQ